MIVTAPHVHPLFRVQSIVTGTHTGAHGRSLSCSVEKPGQASQSLPLEMQALPDEGVGPWLGLEVEHSCIYSSRPVAQVFPPETPDSMPPRTFHIVCKLNTINLPACSLSTLPIQRQSCRTCWDRSPVRKLLDADPIDSWRVASEAGFLTYYRQACKRHLMMYQLLSFTREKASLVALSSHGLFCLLLICLQSL